jgi:hypothetical protein
MSIPGFTAASTQYRSEQAYYTIPGRDFVSTQVIPQQNDQDPCRGACKCCAYYQYQGCCGRCDSCLQEPTPQRSILRTF